MMRFVMRRREPVGCTGQTVRRCPLFRAALNWDTVERLPERVVVTARVRGRLAHNTNQVGNFPSRSVQSAAHIREMDQQGRIVHNIVRYERLIAQEDDARRLMALRTLLAKEHDKLFASHRQKAR